MSSSSRWRFEQSGSNNRVLPIPGRETAGLPSASDQNGDGKKEVQGQRASPLVVNTGDGATSGVFFAIGFASGAGIDPAVGIGCTDIVTHGPGGRAGRAATTVRTNGRINYGRAATTVRTNGHTG